MSDSTLIYPRSPRETMSGWIYLPRFVDKIRLHLAGRLHPDYQGNLGKKGFDLAWLNAAGLEAEAFIAVVKATITDGEVADWVAKNVKRTDAEKSAFREQALNHGRQNDESLRALLKLRKEQAGLGARDDIQTFFEFIDADEKRS
ncbi:MAG: DUF5069 domain-containing protein [Verrucomicrobiales bacterium]|nr:DUF5069 domain-containing protein [Verrucomicrobiales bacterium]